MDFILNTSAELCITDQELWQLLMQVYVDGGYTDQERAQVIFDPVAVRQRGIIIGARESLNQPLAGMVIVVPPKSPACRFAVGREAELHLLGVRAEYRKQGLGRLLVESALAKAKQNDYEKMILWTQPGMSAAQHLYESMGFRRIADKDFDRNGYYFHFYEMDLVHD